jgi:hypothetical protein
MPIFLASALLSLSALSSWLKPGGAQIAAADRVVLPVRLARLELPRYGSDHLLICRERGSSMMLPLLLEWSDGQRLEREAGAGIGGKSAGFLAEVALGAALLGRRRFFDAAGCAPAQRRLGDDLTAVLLNSLEGAGLRPVVARLTPLGGSAVRYMDMGVNTPAAPAGVALAPVSASLVCRGANGEERVLPLEGAGEAVALALRCPGLRVTVADALWEEHAVECEEDLPTLVAQSEALLH